MDTSISQALVIVASVLLAMLVMGFVTRTFLQTSQWASSQDQEEMIEQAQKFNKEWEVYDKKLMYGVDVISCLNKALSNNDKINNGSIVDGEKYDESYEIKVDVTLNSKELEESMIVYHITKDSNKDIEYSLNDEIKKGVKTLKELKFKFLTTKYKELNNTLFKNEDDKIATKKNKISLTNKELKLSKDSKTDSDVIKLLDASDAISQTIKNTDYTTRNDPEGWTKVEFKSALYYLKNKKFTCKKITYNKDTGRVSEIKFKEL